MSTLERKTTRLLTEAMEENEPAKVLEAFKLTTFLLEANTLCDTDRASISAKDGGGPLSVGAVSPDLYLYCAEAACRFEQWEIVRHCVEQLQKRASLQMPASAAAGSTSTSGDPNAAPSWTDFSVRSMFCEAALLAYTGMTSAKGDALIAAARHPLAKMVRGIAVALEAGRTVLVFAGVQQLWNIAQPLYKNGTYHVLSDVFAFVNKALEAAQVHDPDLRSKWAMRLVTCLTAAVPPAAAAAGGAAAVAAPTATGAGGNDKNSAAANREAEAAAVLAHAEQYATSRTIVPMARAAIAVSSGVSGGKAGQQGGGGGAAMSLLGIGGKNASGDGGSKASNNNSGGVTLAANVVIARALQVLQDAAQLVPAALSNGGTLVTAATANSPPRIIEDLLAIMRDLQTAVTQSAAAAAAATKERTAAAAKARAAAAAMNTGASASSPSSKRPRTPSAADDDGNAATTTFNNNNNNAKRKDVPGIVTPADGALEELLSEAAFLAAFLGVQHEAAQVAERCLVSRHHVARVYAELANAVLLAQRCGGCLLHVQTDTSRVTTSIVQGLVSAVRRIEITLEGALRIQSDLQRNTVVERCVITLWNLALPLTNPETRLTLTKSYKAALHALEAVGSTNNELLRLIQHELALQEADQQFTAKGADRLAACLRIDVAASSSATLSVAAALAATGGAGGEKGGGAAAKDGGAEAAAAAALAAAASASFIREHERWTHYQLRSLQLKRDLYTKHSDPELEALRLLLQASDTAPGARPPILTRVLGMAEKHELVVPCPERRRRPFPTEIDSWDDVLGAADIAAAAAASINKGANKKQGGGLAASLRGPSPLADSARKKSTAAGGGAGDALGSGSIMEQSLSEEEERQLVQQQWERTQMWSLVRSCAWAFPSVASVEIVRAVSEALLPVGSNDREVIVEQVRAALSHAQTHLFEVRQVGLRFGQYELTASSPDELQSDVKNFQRAIEVCRNAEHGFMTMLVAGAVLSHNLAVTRGFREERWCMSNCIIALWDAFRESFESGLYVVAFPALDKMMPLFLQVLGAMSVAPGFGAAQNRAGGGSVGTGGGGSNARGDKNADESNPDGIFGGPLPSTFESSMLSSIGVAAVRAALQQYVAECLKIDLGSRSSLADLRRIASTDFTRFSGPHDPSSLLLAHAIQWVDALIPLCISAEARELCKLGVVIRRFQGKPADPRSDPVLQITAQIEIADAAPTADERALALVQAVELLQSAPTVELCARVADACVRYPGCERLCIASCAIGQDLYRCGKLGKPQKPGVLTLPASSGSGVTSGRKPGSSGAPRTPRGGPKSDADKQQQQQQEDDTSSSNSHLAPDAEDWMFLCIMLQCQGCASARLSGGGIDHATSEKILLRSLENLANSAAAATRVIPEHRLALVAKSVALFKAAADELVSVSNGSASAVRDMLPALRAILANPILAVVGAAITERNSATNNPFALIAQTLGGAASQHQIGELQIDGSGGQQQQPPGANGSSFAGITAAQLTSDLARLMLLMVRALHLQSLAEEGLSFLLSALKILPNTEHKAFWDLDAAMRCSTGAPLNSTLLRVKEYDVETQAQVWAAIARNAKNSSDQLFALTQATRCFSPAAAHPTQHATHLVALATWLFRNDEMGKVQLSDIRAMMLRAIDLVWRDFSAVVLLSAGAGGGRHHHNQNRSASSSSAFGGSSEYGSDFVSSTGDNNSGDTSARSGVAGGATHPTARSSGDSARSALAAGGGGGGRSRRGTNNSSSNFAISRRALSMPQAHSVTSASGVSSGVIDSVYRSCDARTLVALLQCVAAFVSVAPLRATKDCHLTRSDALLIAHACVVALWRNTVAGVNPILAREAQLREQRAMREHMHTDALSSGAAGVGGSVAGSGERRRPGRAVNRGAATPAPADLLAPSAAASGAGDGGQAASPPPPPVSRVKSTAFVVPTTITGWTQLAITPTFGAALLRIREQPQHQQDTALSFHTVRDPSGLCCALELLYDAMVGNEMQHLAAPVAALEELVASVLWAPSHVQEVVVLACEAKRKALAQALGRPLSGGASGSSSSSSKDDSSAGGTTGNDGNAPSSSSSAPGPSSAAGGVSAAACSSAYAAVVRAAAHRCMQLLNTSLTVVPQNQQQQQHQPHGAENDRQLPSAHAQVAATIVGTSSPVDYATLPSRWVTILRCFSQLDSVGNAVLSLARDVAHLCSVAGDTASMNRALAIAGRALQLQGHAPRTVQVLHGVAYAHMRPQEMIATCAEEMSVLLQLEDVPAATAVLELLDSRVKSIAEFGAAAAGVTDNSQLPPSERVGHLALRQFVAETLAPELQLLFSMQTAQVLLTHCRHPRLRAATRDAIDKYVAKSLAQFAAVLPAPDHQKSSGGIAGGIDVQTAEETARQRDSPLPRWRTAAHLLWLKVSHTLAESVASSSTFASSASSSSSPGSDATTALELSTVSSPYSSAGGLAAAAEAAAAAAGTAGRAAPSETSRGTSPRSVATTGRDGGAAALTTTPRSGRQQSSPSLAAKAKRSMDIIRNLAACLYFDLHGSGETLHRMVGGGGSALDRDEADPVAVSSIVAASPGSYADAFFASPQPQQQQPHSVSFGRRSSASNHRRPISAGQNNSSGQAHQLLSAEAQLAAATAAATSTTAGPRAATLQFAFGLLSHEMAHLAALRRSAVALYRKLPHVASVSYPTVDGAERAGLGAALSSFMRSTKRTRRAEAKLKARAAARADLERARDLVRHERAREVDARRAQRRQLEEQAALNTGKKGGGGGGAGARLGGKLLAQGIPASMMTEVDFGFTPLDRMCGIPSPEPSDSEEESLDEDSQSDDERECQRAVEELLIDDDAKRREAAKKSTSPTAADAKNSKTTACAAAAAATPHSSASAAAGKAIAVAGGILHQLQKMQAETVDASSPSLSSWAHSAMLAIAANPLAFDATAQLDTEEQLIRHLALPARLLRLPPDEDGSGYDNETPYMFSRSVDLAGGGGGTGGDGRSDGSGGGAAGGGGGAGGRNTNINRTGKPAGGKDGGGAGGKGGNARDNSPGRGGRGGQQQQSGGGNTNNSNRSGDGGAIGRRGVLGVASHSAGKSSAGLTGSGTGHNTKFAASPTAPLMCFADRSGVEILQQVILAAEVNDRWRLLGTALGMMSVVASRETPSPVSGITEAMHESHVGRLLELSQAACIAHEMRRLWQQLVDASAMERVGLTAPSGDAATAVEASRMMQRLRLPREVVAAALTGPSSTTSSNSSSASVIDTFLAQQQQQQQAGSTSTTNSGSNTNSNAVYHLTITRAGAQSGPVYAVLRRGASAVDMRMTDDISEHAVRDVIRNFAGVARQRFNVLGKAASSGARAEAFAIAEATHRVALDVFARSVSPLLGELELAFAAYHARNTALPLLVLHLDLEFQSLPWESLPLFYTSAATATGRSKESGRSDQQPASSTASAADADASNNNINNINSSSSAAVEGTTTQQASTTPALAERTIGSTSPCFFRGIVRDLSLFHCIARCTGRKFETAIPSTGASGSGGKSGGGGSGSVGSNAAAAIAASAPNGMCLAIVDHHSGGSSFDPTSDADSRPRGYLWRHCSPAPSPLEGALSQVESFFARNLLQGGEVGTLLPTSIFYSANGRFPFVIRSSVWCSADLAHVRAAYILDGGVSQHSTVTDEAAAVKSATSHVEQPFVIALLMLARGVEFVAAQSHRMPLTAASVSQVARLVMRVAGGDIGAEKTRAGGAAPSDANNNNSSTKTGGGGGKQDSHSAGGAAMAKAMSEHLHFALHCQPVLAAQQAAAATALAAANSQQPATAVAAAAKNRSLVSSHGPKHTAAAAADADRTLEISGSEVAALALFGAAL